MIPFQILAITADNASNNKTFMSGMCQRLQKMGIPFTPDDQYVWCFAHILNLVCQDALTAIGKEITGKDEDVIDDGSVEQEEIEDIDDESDNNDDDGELETSTATILKRVSVIHIWFIFKLL